MAVGVTKLEKSVSVAKTQLTELLRRAEAGEEVILTRRGHEWLGKAQKAGCRQSDQRPNAQTESRCQQQQERKATQTVG